MKIEIKEKDKVIASASINYRIISNVLVEKEYRGKGYGSKLLDKCLETGDKFYLYVDSNNKTAYNLYIKKGFKVYSIIKTSDSKIYRMKWKNLDL